MRVGGLGDKKNPIIGRFGQMKKKEVCRVRKLTLGPVVKMSAGEETGTKYDEM